VTRILLVDDEPNLQRMMQTYLKQLGYDVEACSDATSAEEAFARSPNQFELIVADLTLPDGAGDQMAVKMAQADSKVRVLLCSGYPVDWSHVPNNLRTRFAELQKPFLPNMLASSIEKLLQKNK
jgi:DNA-binding NtrC family response regulator